MNIEECYQQLQTEKAHHQQTLNLLGEICKAWYQEHGEDFRFTNFPNGERPSILRRSGRLIWPFKLFVK